jgi:hypothetical protein
MIPFIGSLNVPISGPWRLHASFQKCNKETEMSESKKATVTVGMGWFSSNPIFEEVLEAVNRELREKKFLSPEAVEALEALRPLNGGQPFTGHTHYGPHTWITIETPSLAKAVVVARILEDFLWHEFSGVTFFFGTHKTGGLHVSYAGKSLAKLIGSLETALSDAQQDLKGTRRFLPSKRIQALRLRFQELYG